MGFGFKRRRLREDCRGELSDPDGVVSGGLVDDQDFVLVADGETAIQVLVDVDPCSGITDALGARGDLEPFPVEGDGVVAGDGALMLEGEDLFRLQIGRPGTVGGAGVSCRESEAGVEGGQVGPEDAIGFLQGSSLSFAQFLDQSILKGAKESFHTSLGLRGVGGEGFDSQLMHQAAELAAWQLSR
jgi:hypothetical protein